MMNELDELETELHAQPDANGHRPKLIRARMKGDATARKRRAAKPKWVNQLRAIAGRAAAKKFKAKVEK